MEPEYIAGISLLILMLIGAINLFLLIMLRDHLRKLFKITEGQNQRFGRLVDYLEGDKKLKRRNGR